ncbi:hypothetical protein LQ567_09975 [Niabella pedocola]|uniref:Transposase InsH N-terminal domain-containing protein n=1 Tax=Niabella pedocola TaxID=1752077 RepID=A0ABS8PPR5_9BACT|nr:hypothetical protein [Niabella pedocola]MCD2423090.1 hypothetical protein [Niabella pedocola]
MAVLVFFLQHRLFGKRTFFKKRQDRYCINRLMFRYFLDMLYQWMHGAEESSNI